MLELRRLLILHLSCFRDLYLENFLSEMSVLFRRALPCRMMSPLFPVLPRHLRAGMCSSKELIQQKLSDMVAAKDVVVFMKGVPEAPQCGFSNAVVQILRMHGVDNFDAHNVLEDDEIREVCIPGILKAGFSAYGI